MKQKNVKKTFSIFAFMNVAFYKYQGAGNDFVMIDNRKLTYKFTQNEVSKICNRHFGIGADGLILLENDVHSDFRMVYYNSDGNESTMCGNGGRCIVAFAKELGIITDKTTFNAIDGLHQAIISETQVSLQMIDVLEIKNQDNDFELQTGSPHYVRFVEDLQKDDFIQKAQEVRNSDRYKKDGINVNFVQIKAPNILHIRTYERGVENETLACGTGVTAAALAYAHQTKNTQSVQVNALGGNLSVDFNTQNQQYTQIWLNGPAEKVFYGNLNL